MTAYFFALLRRPNGKSECIKTVNTFESLIKVFGYLFGIRFVLKNYVIWHLLYCSKICDFLKRGYLYSDCACAKKWESYWNEITREVWARSFLMYATYYFWPPSIISRTSRQNVEWTVISFVQCSFTASVSSIWKKTLMSMRLPTILWPLHVKARRFWPALMRRCTKYEYKNNSASNGALWDS